MNLPGAVPRGSGGFEDRRSRRRFTIRLQLEWQERHGRQVLDSGTGKTVNLSSGGLVFESDRELKAPNQMQLSVFWPFLLHSRVALRLVIVAVPVRIQGRTVAVRFLHHEFRTGRLDGQPLSAPVRRERPPTELAQR